MYEQTEIRKSGSIANH